MMKNTMTYEIRSFSNGMQTLDLLCEISITGGSQIFRRVKSPEGRYYTPKFKLGEQIYITYHKEKWFMTSTAGRPPVSDTVTGRLGVGV